MDLALMALVDLVEIMIMCVDDRYGRPAAWAVAILGCAALFGLPVLIIMWLVR